MSQDLERDSTNNFLHVPEYALFDIIEHSIELIRNQVQNNVPEKETYLYQIMKGLGHKRIDLYNILLRIFKIVDPTHPDYITPTLGWPDKLGENLQVCVIQRNDGYGDNTLGVGAYQSMVWAENDTAFQEINMRHYQSMCDIMVVGNNTSILTALTTFFKAMIQAFEAMTYLAEVFGWQNVQMGIKDVQLNQNITPKTFIKTVTISFQYPFYIPSWNHMQALGNIIFRPHIKAE